MKFFNHVLYPWLLSIVIVLAGLFIYEVIIEYANISRALFNLIVLIVPFVAFLLALPSLLIGSLFLEFIQITQYSVLEKFFLWCLAALVSIILNIVFMGLLFAWGMIELRFFLFLWPAYPAVIISLSVRYKYFLLLHTRTIKQEANIV